ncbi:glycosyltransferase family 9 protein [Pandoraea sp. PE-S2R-1]|uniref:glycosyltransferase family 9 protein n=1 Tax=Pandoraea sp. PE-S2R-1 TaxID=1986994 RepID=UPI00113081BF|nr:glycosyltransferase family 9 protein [Pandoraea sp. PE-S2R-1]
MTKPSSRTPTPCPPASGDTSPPDTTDAIAQAWAQVGAALSPHPDCPLPTWAGGGDTLHQHLIVIGSGHEGDIVGQLRHLETVAARFGKVGFVGPANVRRLVEWSLGDRVVVLSRMPRDVSDWDLRCALGALAKTLGPHAAAAHAGMPHLRVAATSARHWRDRLAASAQHGLCVGIAWPGITAGGQRPGTGAPPETMASRGHSLANAPIADRSAELAGLARLTALTPLIPLLAVPGVSWVPLGSHGHTATDATPPSRVDWIDWRTDCDDLADEAALIDNLDLVISLDIARTHLAGGLGVPVWHVDTSTQPAVAGYAQMRLFGAALSGNVGNARSGGNDWRGAVEAAAQALHSLSAEFQGWTR